MVSPRPEPSRSFHFFGFKLAAASPVDLGLLGRGPFDLVFEAVPVRRCASVGKAKATPLRATGILAQMDVWAAFRFLGRADFVTHAAGPLDAAFYKCSH